MSITNILTAAVVVLLCIKWCQNFQEEVVDSCHYIECLKTVAECDDLARRAFQNGLKYHCNYRNFSVGCSGLAFNTKTSAYKIFVAFNLMQQKEAIVCLSGKAEMPKVCAEQAVLAAAGAEGFDTMLRLTVCGEAQEDNGSGILSPTLHPCLFCRHSLGQSSIIKPETIIRCISPIAGECKPEEFTFQELCEYHKMVHNSICSK
jgi:cytidine deaminase